MLAIQISQERASRRRRAAAAAVQDQRPPTGDMVTVEDEQVQKRRRLDHDLQVALAIAQEDHAIIETISRPNPAPGIPPHPPEDRDVEQDHTAHALVEKRQGQMSTPKDLGLSKDRLRLPRGMANGCATMFKLDPGSELFATLTGAHMPSSGLSGMGVAGAERQEDMLEMQLQSGEKEPNGIWGFDRKYTGRFPSLLKRNFFVVQKHQATALHYDLRMQVNGGTFSWAIPKGFIGLGEGKETQHQAIETTVHGIPYSTVEGPDGHTHSSGVKCGTIVWDIGEYEIGKKHEREGSPGEEDALGEHEELQLAIALDKTNTRGHRRTIYFTLKCGRKLSNHSFILKETNTQYKSDGTAKISWMLMLQKGTKPIQRTPDIDLSMLSGRSLEDVCSDTTAPRAAHDDDI